MPAVQGHVWLSIERYCLARPSSTGLIQALGLQRLMSERNVYRNAFGTLYLMAYVDDLLSFKVDSEVTRVFAAIRRFS